MTICAEDYLGGCKKGAGNRNSAVLSGRAWSCASRISCHHRVRTPLATCRSRRVVIRPPGSPCTIASAFEPRLRRVAVRSCACGRWRGRANSLKAIFESNREKLVAARAEVREVRRTAKQPLALKQEVARPGQLLAETGARKRSTVVSLRMENAGLKTAMRVLKGRGGERQASFEQVVRAQEREEAAGVIEARPAARHSWPRPAFEEVEERLEVAEDACSCCVANGSHQDHRDQKRRIVRRGCDCPGSPSEVAAGTAFGCGRMCCTSACIRPLRRVQGLSPETLASEPDAAPVRAASGRDPRAPGSAPCRCIRAPREVRKSRLAPDIGQP